MPEVINILTAFKTIICCKCEFPFAVTAATKERWVNEHTSFNCPSCGTSQAFRGKTTEEELREALERSQREVKWQTEFKEEARQESNKLRHRLNGTKGYITKLKNRVGNGVCPCCNRSFKDLHQHMKTKHPKFNSEDEK